MAHTQAMRQLLRMRPSSPPSTVPPRPASALSRRALLGGLAAASLPLVAAPASPSLDIGIVGAGLGGLVCAEQLQKRGIVATIYDANSRLGGRCVSVRNFFPGQVAEGGGEFIDTAHKTMINYARQFGLPLEDVNKQPGTIRYYFRNQFYSEAAIVEEFRVLVDAMRDDLRQLSSGVAYDNNTPVDRAIDQLSLSDYLYSRGATPLIRAVIEEAYVAEYGLSPAEQSCLNFLFFVHADRRSRFTPFGVFSDERYHVIGGNDAIVQGIASGLRAPLKQGFLLQKVRKTAAGRLELTFLNGRTTVTATHDAVVLAIPFATLRNVELDPSLGLPPAKQKAIQELGYGYNSKMMLGFDQRPWLHLYGSNGTSYSDLSYHQTTWESNPVYATANRAIITDFSGAERGLQIDPGKVQTEASRFLNDFDRVFPGALAAATRLPGEKFRVHLEAWPSNPLARGSYTCYRTGQFTTLAGIEGAPVGNLFFSGEHTDSFYSWQGYMEGACLAGIATAGQILA